jgi:DNA polymerase
VTQPPSFTARSAAALLLRQATQAGLCSLPVSVAQKAELPPLSVLAQEIAGCTRCKLAGTRQLTVPGEGPARARLMLVGEGPGAEEDRSGRPFVGAAGQLLDRILQSGMGLRREDVFIANVLKCRPPGNRDPEPDEVSACLPYLEEQIRLVQPELLLALGRHAAHALLETSASVQKLRGLIHVRPRLNQRVLVTFHPAYLLRNPAAKKDCWQDIQIGMDFLGLPRPSRSEPAPDVGNQASRAD